MRKKHFPVLLFFLILFQGYAEPLKTGFLDINGTFRKAARAGSFTEKDISPDEEDLPLTFDMAEKQEVLFTQLKNLLQLYKIKMPGNNESLYFIEEKNWERFYFLNEIRAVKITFFTAPSSLLIEEELYTLSITGESKEKSESKQESGTGKKEITFKDFKKAGTLEFIKEEGRFLTVVFTTQSRRLGLVGFSRSSFEVYLKKTLQELLPDAIDKENLSFPRYINNRGKRITINSRRQLISYAQAGLMNRYNDMIKKSPPEEEQAGMNLKLILGNPGVTAGQWKLAGITELIGKRIKKPLLKWKINGANNDIIYDLTIIEEVIYSRSDDGYLKAYDRDGAMLWSFYSIGVRGQNKFSGTPLHWANGKIFVPAWNFESRKIDYLACLEAKNGTRLWQFKGENSIKSAPITAGKVVSIATFGEEGYSNQKTFLYGLSTDTGKLLWKRTVEDQVSVTLYRTSSARTFFFGLGNNLHSIDPATGKDFWIYPMGGNLTADPVIRKDAVYFISENNKITAVKELSGKRIWETPFPVNKYGSTFHSNPLVRNGLLYAISIDDNLTAFDTNTGSPVWTFSNPIALKDSAISLFNGIIYAGTFQGKLFAIDAKTGGELWNYQDSQGWQLFRPVLLGETLYTSSFNGMIYSFKIPR